MLRTLMIYGVLTIALIWAGYFEYKSYNPLFSFDDANVHVTTLITGCGFGGDLHVLVLRLHLNQ